MITFFLGFIIIVWSFTGFGVFLCEAFDDKRPNGFSKKFVSHIIEGPISWIIGIGCIMYCIIENVKGRLM